MMKSKVKVKKDNFVVENQNAKNDEKKKKEPNLDLMVRLATGQKA